MRSLTCSRILNHLVCFNECIRIDVVDILIGHKVSNHVCSDPLEHCMLNNDTTMDENPKVVVCALLSLSTIFT